MLGVGGASDVIKIEEFLDNGKDGRDGIVLRINGLALYGHSYLVDALVHRPQCH